MCSSDLRRRQAPRAQVYDEQAALMGETETETEPRMVATQLQGINQRFDDPGEPRA